MKPKKPGPNRIDAQREVSPDRPQEEKKKSGLLCVIRTHSWVGERERIPSKSYTGKLVFCGAKTVNGIDALRLKPRVLGL